MLLFSFEALLEGVDGLLLELGAHCVVELGHLVNGDALPIFGALGPLVALVSLGGLSYFLVAAGHGIPHAGVLGPGRDGLVEVVEGVVVHVLELVGLA